MRPQPTAAWLHAQRSRAEFNIALRHLHWRKQQLARTRAVAESASAYVRAVKRGEPAGDALNRLIRTVESWRRTDN